MTEKKQTPITELLPNWKAGKPRTTLEEIKAAHESLRQTLREAKWFPDAPDKPVPTEPLKPKATSD